MASDLAREPLDLPEARVARYWLGLAVAVLMLAGFFSLVRPRTAQEIAGGTAFAEVEIEIVHSGR